MACLLSVNKSVNTGCGQYWHKGKVYKLNLVKFGLEVNGGLQHPVFNFCLDFDLV